MKKIIHHIKRIRKQPEHVRRHISHVAVLVCAIILGLLWIYSLGRNTASPEAQTKTNDATSPFSAIKDNLVRGYQSLSQ